MQKVFEQLLHTSWIELIAMVTGLLFPILSSFEKKIGWLFGGISSVLYVYLTFTSALYSDAILNLYYVIMAVVGYLMWTGILKDKKKGLRISRLSFSGWMVSLLVIGLYTGITGSFFNFFTDASFPYLDAFIAGTAFLATWLQARKKIDNWYMFLVVEVLSVWLFWQKGYVLTSVLFIIYCFICAFAIWQWSQKMKSYPSQ